MKRSGSVKTWSRKWVVLMMAVLIFTMPVTGYANATEKSGVEILCSYGIMHGDPDGGFRPDDFITRAEATALVYRLYEVKSADPVVFSVGFSDMEGHWAASEVAAAAKVGLVQGTDNGTFEPDSVVTLQDFLKMTVTLLGYQPRAERMGYPMGYAITATNLGLTKGISSSMEAFVTRSMAADILANALNVPLMEAIETEDETAYVIKDGTDGTQMKTLRLALETE